MVSFLGGGGLGGGGGIPTTATYSCDYFFLSCTEYEIMNIMRYTYIFVNSMSRVCGSPVGKVIYVCTLFYFMNCITCVEWIFQLADPIYFHLCVFSHPDKTNTASFQ